jgi:hypothetical protein
VHPQANRGKYTVMFLQDFSQWCRKKVQRVSTPLDLRMSFLQYVTGRMPESDRESFEEKLLMDQDFSDTAAACEQDLIDAYALHSLDTEDARAMRLWIEAAPERVQRVAMARALLNATPAKGRRRQQLGVAFAAAACLLVGATLYLVNAGILHRARGTTQLLTATSAPPNTTPLAAANFGITAAPDVVLIAAERTRGRQKITTYRIHRENSIQLQVVLPGETAVSGYRLRVASLADQNKILLQQNNLEAQSMAGHLYLTATLPPGALPPASYIASISRQNNTLVSVFTLKW